MRPRGLRGVGSGGVNAYLLPYSGSTVSRDQQPERFIMQLKAGVFAVATLFMVASGPAWAGCMAGERIDGTTADQAKRKIEAAGFTDVRDLSKGCDNYWHGEAM